MRFSLLAIAVALVAFEARGETCPPGQVKNEDTRDHCCWPNQVWSGKRQACVGIPLCPAPLAVDGETCKGATPPPAETAKPQAVQAQPVAPLQPAAQPAPSPQPGAHEPAAVPPPPPPVQPAPPPVLLQPAPQGAPPPVGVQPAPQPVYLPPNAVFVNVAPAPATKTVYVQQPGKIVTGAFLLALAVGAIGASVPLWQDATDDKQSPLNKHLSGNDGLCVLGAVVLDAAGIVFGAVGGSTLGKGIRGRAVEVPLAWSPEPVHGRVANVEVALAF